MINLTESEIRIIAGDNPEEKESLISKSNINNINIRFVFGKNRRILQSNLKEFRTQISNIDDKSEMVKSLVQTLNAYIDCDNHNFYGKDQQLQSKYKLDNGKYSVADIFIYTVLGEVSNTNNNSHIIKLSRTDVLFAIKYIKNLENLKVSKDVALKIAHNINIFRTEEMAIRTSSETKKYEEMEVEKEQLRYFHSKKDEQGDTVTANKEVTNSVTGNKETRQVTVYENVEAKNKDFANFNKSYKKDYDDYNNWLNEEIEINVEPLSLDEIPNSVTQKEMNTLSLFIED